MGYSSKIVLNVGGQLFTTSLTTLRSVPESMISAMFSPEWSQTIKTGEASEEAVEEVPFIDRDPILFRVILHYLRTRQLRLELATSMEGGPVSLGALRDEAHFFGLEELEKELQKREENAWYISSKATQAVLVIVVRGTDHEFHFNKELVQFLPLSNLNQAAPTMNMLLSETEGIQNHEQLANELFRFREDSKRVAHKILQLKEAEGFGLAGIGVSKSSPSEKFWVLLKRA
ncbi:POZ domain-containing protein [Basidiobolus meristosporus CBS 931.73]|uniref:POZ domain-containing protein n=1 Tax=Basidiobolus meristosporus CBS 931.73 TaxID=1314790 RepID=A0A1Y1XI53_9FUNG|nr:POZ domain-containing protein [Basidiobolus meristosporus CBS 931.73]|eukprot:ORX85438.1 POZ domain-containing protein [Basidiobolus meristosporus CBS 931.73]